MPDYSKGKIYKIVSDDTDVIYVGSTTHKYLKSYFSNNHRCKYRYWLEGKESYKYSFELMKLPHNEIFQLQPYPCNSRHELEAKEREWMEKLRKDGVTVINKNVPGRTAAEWRQDNPDYHKEYQQDNPDKHRNYQKKYRDKNQVECACGGSSSKTKSKKARHEKTGIHQAYLAKQNENA